MIDWQMSAQTADRVRVHRGQYSDATLNELESQNDGQVEGILGKVKILKDVRYAPPPPHPHTLAPPFLLQTQWEGED